MSHCPRCDRQLIKNHQELGCLVHGLVSAPVPAALDLVEEPGPQSQRDVAANAGRPWTNEDRALLLAHKDTHAAKDIAAMLDRTERSIHHRLSKDRTRKTRVDAASQDSSLRKNLNDELEDQARPGALPDLARQHGLSQRAVKERLYRRGVQLRSADGLMSVADVMRAYGCSRRRVERLMALGILRAHRPKKRGVAVRIAQPNPRAEQLLRIRVRARGGRRRG